MKKIIIISLFFLTVLCFNISAQEITSSGKNGNNFNIGLGIGGNSGYNGFGQSLTAFHISYKFNTAKKIALAPAGDLYTYRIKFNWGDDKQGYPYKHYYFLKTVIPVDDKSLNYFDQLFKVNSGWDFYQADLSDNATVNSSVDNDYLGVELSLNLSSGSTINLSIH